MPKHQTFTCQCHNPQCDVRFDWDEEWGLELSFQMPDPSHFGFFTRLKIGIKYILGMRPADSWWNGFLLKQEDIKKLHVMLSIAKYKLEEEEKNGLQEEEKEEVSIDYSA